MTLYNDIMPYFDKFIHVYGWNLSVLWYPSQIWTPKSFSIANFRHPVSKSWLRPWSHIYMYYWLREFGESSCILPLTCWASCSLPIAHWWSSRTSLSCWFITLSIFNWLLTSDIALPTAPVLAAASAESGETITIITKKGAFRVKISLPPGPYLDVIPWG